jgi:cytochrome c553
MKKLLLLITGILVIIPAISFLGTFNGIPRTWDMKAIKKFHLPPPDSTVEVKYASEEYYDSLPDHVIYKTFPMYIREFERPGYLDSLRNLEPEITFDASTLRTPEDWVKAGEMVFNWPVAYSPVGGNVAQLKQSDFANGNGRITSEGIYPFSQYVLTEKGKLVVGSLSCASCHTRVTDSGEAIPGAQGNIFNTIRFANAVRTQRIPFPVMQAGARNLSYAPWAPGIKVAPDTPEEFASYIESIPAGAVDRQGGGYLYPFAVPSLIGIKDIKYLDRTGLMKHESPGDMMRYAAFNQGMDMLTSYNGFIPGGENKNSELPPPSEWNHPFGYTAKKYTDAQLYALTQYIYSLKPPKNPNQFPTSLIEKGRKAFTKAGCVTCHTPPLYTNNKLTPVNGFEPPKDHFDKYDIFNVSVETDSVSALYTRRGTGYYKIPSLRGVWFQSAFFHNGTLTTLEEVLDPKRLSPEFVPTGFMPPHLKSMAVKGHPFGLELNEEEKKALIAFMKIL